MNSEPEKKIKGYIAQLNDFKIFILSQSSSDINKNIEEVINQEEPEEFYKGLI